MFGYFFIYINFKQFDKMGTEIKTIKGSCHYYFGKGLSDVEHKDAEVSLTRFFNGKKRGANIQLTVTQDGEYGTSYIHLTKKTM